MFKSIRYIKKNNTFAAHVRVLMNTQLETAITAALQAGEEILKIYNDPHSDFGIERKADNSPLTIADRKSNEVIMSHLEKTPFPIISEENKAIDYSIRKQWKTVWIVDPLDGTKEFIKRNGEFTVNIALTENSIPVLGVIYIPVKQILYFGTTDTKAYKAENIVSSTPLQEIEKRAIMLPLNHTHPGCIVVASRSHMNPETEDFIRQLQEKFSPVKLVSIGSSIKICLVAEGCADIYPRFAPTMEWDTAAGHAIIKAAGKELYQQDGKTPLTYNKENLLNPWFIVK